MGKNTITEWRDNYDDTEQYPMVVPSKGYYNICNGSFGIGTGLSSSIPQFNLREVNDAMTRLLLNPSVAESELICMPDFATGAELLNPTEVKQSLLKGTGKACLLRSVIEYDSKENALVVTEIPYGVYTNTICGELEEILNHPEENPGIERFNDLTGSTPLIKIYLTKAANINTVLRYLYKNTSLQHWYAINLTMLDGGKFPRVFTWKEALQAHIEHEKLVYRRGFEYDRQKALDRVHILDGLLIAISAIDEVVQVIKSATSTVDAANKLKTRFELDDVQVKAILDMKLSRLAHLEVNKLEKERTDLNNEIERINRILNNETLFNNCLVAGWREISTKYGDERRTKLVETQVDENGLGGEKAPVKDEPIWNLFTNKGTLLCIHPSPKLNLAAKDSSWKETIYGGYQTTTLSIDYVYDADGIVWSIDSSKLEVGMINQLDKPNRIIGHFRDITKEYLITVTNAGTVKKTKMSEYVFKRAIAVCKLRSGEQVIYVAPANDTDFVFMLGENHKLVKLPVKDLTPTGRLTIGAKGNDGTKVISATIGSNTDTYFTAAANKGKFSRGDAFLPNARGSNGQVVTEGMDFIARCGDQVVVVENGTKFNVLDAREAGIKGKTAVGAKVSTILTPQFIL